MKKKSTIVNRKNNKDFDKFQKSLENLKTVRAVTLMFSLRYFEKTCVNNGNDNKTFCNYLLETNGHKLIIELIEKFNKKEQALTVLLSILDSCLINLPEDITAFKLVDGKFCKILFDILENSEFDDCKIKSFNILNKLCIYDLTHEIMIEQGTLDFINKSLEYFIRKDINNLKKEEMIRIAQIIDIIKYFGYNNELGSVLSKSGLINNMIKIYTQNQDVSFLRDLVVKSLVKISQIEKANAKSKSKLIRDKNEMIDYILTLCHCKCYCRRKCPITILHLKIDIPCVYKHTCNYNISILFCNNNHCTNTTIQ